MYVQYSQFMPKIPNFSNSCILDTAWLSILSRLLIQAVHQTYLEYEFSEYRFPIVHLDNLHGSDCLADQLYPFVCMRRCFSPVQIISFQAKLSTIYWWFNIKWTEINSNLLTILKTSSVWFSWESYLENALQIKLFAWPKAQQSVREHQRTAV